ncbi:hypothetical protein C2845_PM15G06970 [Panicum miliaceum]|uniref:Uncharacterized protein n=1 Tax=Panicum miliaceum TaxID=4540 RepID=A0A3L6Q895_PANMI|nr:hypothetical protein C2845_PM15G06970 [Panicum miliaceum]
MAPHSASYFIPDTEEQAEDGVEVQPVDDVEGQDAVECQDIEGHAGNLQEEAHSNHTDPLEQDDDAGKELRENGGKY